MLNKYFAVLVLITFGCGFGQLCHINVREPYPLFSKSFGSRNITFRAKENGINLNKGESVEVFCGSGMNFEVPYYGTVDNLQQTESLYCGSDNSLVSGRTHQVYYDTLTAYCSSPSGSSLNESLKKLPNCEGYMNYVIGQKIPFIGTIIKKAMCYDIERFSLKYVNYIAYQQNDIWISNESPSNQLAVDFGQEVDNFDNYFEFMSQESFNVSRDIQRSMDNTFFKDFDFDFVSILQDQVDDKENKDFGYIFNIMWWRLLRQNNWRFFLDALKERTKSGKYLVHTGTYGNATMPVRDSAGELLVDLSVQSSNSVVRAPSYIWSYLKSLTPGNEEKFVVIAHNSPYVLAPSHTEFCTTDICDDIEWLKGSKFGHVRRIPTFGYTFCCRAEEVAKIIEYFPLDTKGFETTTGAPIELTTSEAIQDDNLI